MFDVITGPVQNHFWNQKMSRLSRHKSARIIGPCQYVYEKKCWPGRCDVSSVRAVDLAS